ncbi:MAG: phosphoribosylamine--glycine ligase [Peptostreptococcaceae bacterium]|jgi:phosphoribosylamine--glycine ligase|nr:phosphoribosylamine--glycine ligase [Peptostreptococcaceae bacterium]
MRILIIGNGGREHAIAHKLVADDKEIQLYYTGVNAGMDSIAKRVLIKNDEISKLIDFCKTKEIDLTIVGPEKPLVDGIYDEFNKHNLRIFAPSKKASKLEGSKSYSKEFMQKYDIKTAKFKTAYSYDEALNFLDGFDYPLVIKADGLASGKGVLICQTNDEALQALDDIFLQKVFSEAGNKVVIEEFIDGIEMSILAFVDGKNIKLLESAKDYKRAMNNDEGLNTGGMGNISPNPIYTKDLEEKINNLIIKPFMNGLKEEEIDYKGVIFIGFMIKDNIPYVLEFNVRFGDPETQVLLPRLKTNLVDIMNSCIDGNLDNINLDWSDKKSMCVIMASGGYPLKYEVKKEIKNLKEVDEDIIIYHSGTLTKDDKVFTNGGRVLGVVSLADNYEALYNKVYQNVSKIDFENSFIRTDIGN